MTNPQALRKEHCSNCNNLISGTNGRPSQSGFCSNCSSLIRNGRRKSPTQPNYKQVRLMLENKFKQGHTQAIKEVLEIIEEMETLDIYFNKEMAIKTLILAGRVISGELSIEDIKIKAQLNSQPSNSLNRMLEKVVPSQDKMADTSNIKAQIGSAK